jgi:hypothetical protein
LIVRVTDARGVGVANVDVHWVVTTGEGAIGSTFKGNGQPVTNSTTRTSADGLAQVSLIPTWFGIVRVDARHDGIAGAQSFTADATDAAAQLAVVSGFHQNAKAGRRLVEPLVVRVTDGQGDPVPHVAVHWGITYGEGAFDWYDQGNPVTGVNAHLRTDARGLFALSFTPKWFGRIELNVTAPGIPRSGITFTTDATDPAAAIAVAGGDNQEGKAGEDLAPFVVRVTDGKGNVVPNVRVNWTLEHGWCCLGRDGSPYSDADGLARMSLWPIQLGALQVSAQLAGLHTRVRFKATATVLVIAFGHGGYPIFHAPWSDPWLGDTYVAVPVGTPVEWVNYRPAARFRSISGPPNGAAFDSGMLDRTARFRFVPGVIGNWEYIDQVSGAKATLKAY